MATVTLSKVLKYKKRVQSAMARVEHDIISHNVVSGEAGKEPEREVDIRALQKVRKRLSQHIVDIKCALMIANQPIYRDIFDLAELKSSIAFLNGISTSRGIERRWSSDEAATENFAVVHKSEVDDEVRRMEMDIDAIQDNLDEFNATTKVEIPNFGMINEIKAGSGSGSRSDSRSW